MTASTPLDYKDTLFLPETEFPMRGNLPEKEPETVKFWQEIGLFDKQQEMAKDRPAFILHFGPPFANGDLHAGHALTKTLKDVVIRTQYALGHRAPMVPGWDCHGLPIEWKVEEKYRAAGKNKDEVPVLQFRQECREYAEHWTHVQAASMQRLGVTADWQNPYKTMNFSSEAAIVAELHKFLMNGLLYRGVRPVMWSVVEKTAMAAAEVEYHEHTSSTVYVAFKLKNPKPQWQDASIVIWTTTPWTMPGNRAIAVGADMPYGLYEIKAVEEDSLAVIGQKIVLATELKEAFGKYAKVSDLELLDSLTGQDLVGLTAMHPLQSLHDHYGFDVPVLAGDFVTGETGTGFVHIAPGHGEDDFHLGNAHNLPIPETVDHEGKYTNFAPLFEGLDVYNSQGKEGAANGAVISKLIEAGTLVGKGRMRHQYPHSWRSKAPLIFRTTAQWFIGIDQAMQSGKTLRETALNAIDDTQWVPAESTQRIKAMVSDRPDWCISRQRVWGVPIAIFVNKKTNVVLQDAAVNQRIVDAFQVDGADAWYARPAQDFLGGDYAADDYEQIMDILDVWFESGSTHAFVLEQRPDQQWPADLYLEGSDQHRGWFQSSLLEACGTRGQAPFKAVMTHGFVVDKDGKKMSKSAGNGLSPQDILKQHGADILRLWVLTADFHDDIRISQDAFKAAGELYRRFRNTLRYVLGNLDGFTADERVDLVADYAKLPALEQLILHRVAEINQSVQAHVKHYAFHAAFKDVYDFCNSDLSAFYFDIRKDRLYCDQPDLFERRVTRSVLEVLLDALTGWLAAFIPFTIEEVWQRKDTALLPQYTGLSSVHLRTYPDMPQQWLNPQLATQWDNIRVVRRVVTGAIEVERAKKTIGSSLEAHPHVYIADEAVYRAYNDMDWAELAITSQCTLHHGTAPVDAFTLSDVSGVGVVVGKADGQKCQRSWKILPEVGRDAEYPDLCLRDANAVRYLLKQAKAA